MSQLRLVVTLFWAVSGCHSSSAWLPRESTVARPVVSSAPNDAPSRPIPPSVETNLRARVTQREPLAFRAGDQRDLSDTLHVWVTSVDSLSVDVEVSGMVAALTKPGPNTSPDASTVWLRALRVELVGIEGDTAMVHLDRVTDRVIATETISISKGMRFKIAERVDFEFVRHGHKRTYAGQESPLMVEVDYHQGREPRRTYSLYPPEENDWQWEALRFVLLDWDYDSSMELRVEQLEMEPVAPVTPPSRVRR